MKLTSAALVILATLAPACAFNINKPVVESSYLDQFSAGGGSMKPSSYGPSKGKPSGSKGGVPGSYLDRMGSGGAPAAPAPAAPAAPAPAAPAPAASSVSASSSSQAAATSKDYLSHLNTGAASSSGTGSGMKGYLDALPTRSEASGPGFTSYLGNIGGGGSALKSSTYAPTKSTKAAGSSSPSYSAPAPAAYSSSSASDGQTMIAQEPVLSAINKLSDNMNRNQEATIGVLHEINTSVKTLADKTI